MAAVALTGWVVTWMNQRRLSNAQLRGEEVKAEASRQVAETAAEAQLETAVVQSFATSLNALEESHRKLRTDLEAEQEKRRVLDQKVADLELELTRRQRTIDQLLFDSQRLQRESEEATTQHHDREIYLTSRIRLLEDECNALKAECATLRIQMAEMQQAG